MSKKLYVWIALVALAAVPALADDTAVKDAAAMKADVDDIASIQGRAKETPIPRKADRREIGNVLPDISSLLVPPRGAKTVRSTQCP